MKESAKAAVTYIRSRARALGIDPDFYKNKDIHIHFPEGAVLKDGPSAGITVTVAVISALSGLPVRRDVAMTGEITLRGRVLPIGGLREKTMAARCGVKTVIIPADNESDLENIDQTVRGKLSFVTAENVDSILDLVLFALPRRKHRSSRQFRSSLRSCAARYVSEVRMPALNVNKAEFIKSAAQPKQFINSSIRLSRLPASQTSANRR